MTEQEKAALVGLCRIEIKRWKAASESNPNMCYMVELMEIALAALTAEPVAYFILIDDVYQQLADEYRESPDAKPLYAAPTP